MNAVPHIAFPTMEELEKYRDTSLDFGAWKLRMADDLQVQIYKRLEEVNHE